MLRTLANLFGRSRREATATLVRGIRQFSQGELQERVEVPASSELAEIAIELNSMAANLDRQLATLLEERNIRAAVLASMVEAVIAVDSELRVISLNDAATKLLGTTSALALGKNIHALVRNFPLEQFTRQTLASSGLVEADIAFHGEVERIFQARGTLIRDEEDSVFGALIVLHDVTRVRQLEDVRKDFVSNVSHELRTPITSIRGFVETLLDGALNNEADLRRFLGIILKHVNRLNRLIDDLLNLSKIELDMEHGDLPLAQSDIYAIARQAVELCRSHAEAKNISIEIQLSDPSNGNSELRAWVNASLLETAIANLVDNAIKYSEAGGAIVIFFRRLNGQLELSVKDSGIGIAREHLPRVFERFYRADEGRSRATGGTGLGLAIVKHIALAHRGSVSVESVQGEGSIFTIRIPISPKRPVESGRSDPAVGNL